MSTGAADATFSLFPDLFTSQTPRIKRWTGLLIVYFLLFVFYRLTAVSNHFEAGDRYGYANLTANGPLFSIRDNIELLYNTINRALYLLFHSLGFAPTGYDIGQYLSSIAGPAAVILIARILSRVFACDSKASWVGALCLGLSYGFWRYASEVEVYIPAIFFILLTLNVLFDRYDSCELHPKKMLVPGCLGGFSVLYYQPVAIPLFIAVAPLFLSRDKFVAGVTYGLSGLLVASAGYILIYAASEGHFPDLPSLWHFMFARMNEFSGKETRSVGEVALRAAYLLHYNILAVNWIYGFESLASYYDVLARNRFWEAIEFTARSFRPITYLAAVTYIVVCSISAYIILLSFRAPRRKVGQKEIFVIFWLFACLLVIPILDSSNAEPYIFIVPCVMIAVSIFFFSRIVNKKLGRVLLVLPIAIAIHNYVGGLGMLHSDTGDYVRIRTAWLQANAGSADLVLYAPHNRLGTESQYIRYEIGPRSKVIESNGSIVDLNLRETPFELNEYIDLIYHNSGRVFVFSDFFSPSERIRRRGVPSMWMSEMLKPRAKLVHEASLGDVYEILPTAPVDPISDGSEP